MGKKLEYQTITYEYSSKRRDGSKSIKTDKVEGIGMDIFGNLKPLPKTPQEIEAVAKQGCKLRHPRSTFERVVEVLNE